MSTHIRKTSIEVFEVTRENKREPKYTLWWNDDVQKAISEKKKNATNVYITTVLMKTYRYTKKN
jgi:hypothetical protein